MTKIPFLTKSKKANSVENVIYLYSNLLILETIRLEFQPNIKTKILELLSSLSSDELKIVPEIATFEDEKRMLQSRIAKINYGAAVYSTFEVLDILLEETTSKYGY